VATLISSDLEETQLEYISNEDNHNFKISIATEEGPQTGVINQDRGVCEGERVTADLNLGPELEEVHEEWVEEHCVTPVRIQRLRNLWELGESRPIQRWRSKGGAGTLHGGSSSSSRLSSNSKDLSDGDIVLCNSRLRKGGTMTNQLRCGSWENK